MEKFGFLNFVKPICIKSYSYLKWHERFALTPISDLNTNVLFANIMQKNP